MINSHAEKNKFTSDEMMTIAASRMLKSDDVCFVGIGAPSAACNVARLSHAPDITLIYESGTIGTAPEILPLSIGDGELCIATNFQIMKNRLARLLKILDLHKYR